MVTRVFVRDLQSNYPARVKAVHVYNMGALADFLLTIIKFCMSDKIQQRVGCASFLRHFQYLFSYAYLHSAYRTNQARTVSSGRTFREGLA